LEARTGTAASPRKQASKQPVGWAFPRTGGRRRSGAGEERKRCLRVDEDDVGVALHVLGEEGAAGAAANHHHPRLLPRPRHRRSRTFSPSRAPHPADKLPKPPAHATLLTTLADRWRLEYSTDAMGRWSAMTPTFINLRLNVNACLNSPTRLHARNCDIIINYYNK